MLFGLCCCPDAAHCNPGKKPEKAVWELTANELVKDPAEQMTIRFGLHTGDVSGIVVAAADECWSTGVAPPPLTDPNLPTIAGFPVNAGPQNEPTYKCASLVAASQQLVHQSTLALPDGSRRWIYSANWTVTNIIVGPGGLISQPVLEMFERWNLSAQFWIFEQLQPAEAWRDVYTCLSDEDEYMHRCVLFFTNNADIVFVGPERPPIISVPLRYNAGVIVYRGHDGRWSLCTPHNGCCEPNQGGIFKLTRVDPPPSVAMLSAAGKLKAVTSS